MTFDRIKNQLARILKTDPDIAANLVKNHINYCYYDAIVKNGELIDLEFHLYETPKYYSDKVINVASVLSLAVADIWSKNRQYWFDDLSTSDSGYALSDWVDKNEIEFCRSFDKFLKRNDRNL